MISEIITRVPKARVIIISDITRLMSLLIVHISNRLKYSICKQAVRLTITLFMSCKLSKITAPIYPVAIF